MKQYNQSAEPHSNNKAFNHTGLQNMSNEPGPDTIIYTCPMHPEVKSDRPGKCPKCGMDLVAANEVEE
jgi:hypothetical protein